MTPPFALGNRSVLSPLAPNLYLKPKPETNLQLRHSGRQMVFL